MNPPANEHELAVERTATPVASLPSLRLVTYARMLRSYFESMLTVAGPASDTGNDDFVRHLRLEYGVTADEHEAIWRQLLRDAPTTPDPLAEALDAIEIAARTIEALRRDPSPTHDFLADVLRQSRARSIDLLLRSLRVSTDPETREVVRAGLLSDDPALRLAAVDTLRTALPTSPGTGRVLGKLMVASEDLQQLPLTDWLRTYLDSSDPYIRALTLYALYERGAPLDASLQHLHADPDPLVRETTDYVSAARARGAGADDVGPALITVQKMIALRTAPLFASLAVHALADLARGAVERRYAPGELLCVQGEQRNEVFILLAGEVEVVHKADGEEKVIGGEIAGGVIGEMAILSPAPRMATVIAGPHGVRVLCLHGEAFREALATDITAAYGLIRTLAERLRKAVERGVRQQIQIQQLRIQIDEAKKARQVAAITETDYFRRLQERARLLRQRPSPSADSDQ